MLDIRIWASALLTALVIPSSHSVADELLGLDEAVSLAIQADDPTVVRSTRAPLPMKSGR